MADCGKQIDTAGPVAFGCDLDLGHDGPHRAAENALSVRERAAWEARINPESDVPSPKLSDLQATPQTTAERYTLNPTPVPGTAPTPIPDSPLFTTDDVGDCEKCQSGLHMECLHRADIIAIRMSKTKDAVTTFCGCFQGNSKVHGLNIKQKEPSVPDNTRVSAEDSPSELDEQPAPSEPETVPEPEVESVPIEEEESVMQSADEGTSVATDSAQESVEAPEPDPEPELLVQDRVIEKLGQALEAGNLTDEEYKVLVPLIEASKKKRGTTGELSSFNDKDTLDLAVKRTRDTLVYLSAMQEARDASYERMIEEVGAAISEANKKGKLNVEMVAEVAVKTIFNGAGGPIR